MRSILFPLILLLFINVNCHTQNTRGQAATEQAAIASIAELLAARSDLPIEKRVALYYQLKKDKPDAYNFGNEDELTMYGYRLLWDEKTTEALEIFKLLVDQFPQSANTYDSLGEAYLALGDKQRSLTNYRQALKMNPDNFNAEDQIHRILYPDDKPETEEEKFAKTYSAAAYRADLDQLAARLLKVHPNALKFISAQDFQDLINRKKALVTAQTTYAEFRWHCAEIIASLNCSHTSLGRFGLESKMLPTALRFPLLTRLVDEQLFVVDPLGNADKVAVKDEILSINGLSVQEVISKIYRRIPSQGYVATTKRHEFNFWSTARVPYAFNFPLAYTVTVKGKPDPISLNPAESEQYQFGNPAIKNCNDALCYEVMEDQKTAVLTIKTFNFYAWNNLDAFTSYIDETFQKIHEQGIEHLLIDLRFNGGGSPESSIYLLRYLIDEPFIYASRAEPSSEDGEQKIKQQQTPFENGYRGKCYFLIDGNGQSTTGHFMSLAKVHELGTIVGEELGSNQFCSAGQEVCRLSNTKVVYYVANNTHVTTATSLPDEQGILPDHYITQSIGDYLKKVDTVKEFALKLARQ